jgi:hypothetical protein
MVGFADDATGWIDERRAAVLDRARSLGLLGAEKDTRIAGRVRRALVEAARTRSGLTSDTDLIEYALARVALEDDFGPRLLALKGSVDPEIDLSF